ncbi:MAG: type 4a pilus biogenesis protein PilO [Nitrospirae bacterium]|nr:type 4a pilus biogenesis protein PilO [Nitrospirota bacterium]
MAINLDIKKMPKAMKIVIAVVPSVLLAILFIFLIYLPKNKEIKGLQAGIVNLTNEIANSEVKARKLDALKTENTRLKARLFELQEQLPEEKEVSSDLGIQSGLGILLWKPGTKKAGTGGLYVEIPVDVSVMGGYHDLGVFFSHISNIKRIVNLSGIKIAPQKNKTDSMQIKADFTASTFSAVTEADKAEPGKGRKKKEKKK